jgi:hypothetical protein
MANDRDNGGFDWPPNYEGSVRGTGWGRWLRVVAIVGGAVFVVLIVVAIVTGWGPR